MIRGDLVMDGYYKEPAATAAVMSDGWLHTGDMAVWDEDGYVQIVDRKKDIIISGGENISSIEVERAIAAHPGVLECAVVVGARSAVGRSAGGVCGFEARPPTQRGGDVRVSADPHRALQNTAPLAVQRHGRCPKPEPAKFVKRELREVFWAARERRVQG